jgi:hypothetical protein
MRIASALALRGRMETRSPAARAAAEPNADADRARSRSHVRDAMAILAAAPAAILVPVPKFGPRIPRRPADSATSHGTMPKVGAGEVLVPHARDMSASASVAEMRVTRTSAKAGPRQAACRSSPQPRRAARHASARQVLQVKRRPASASHVPIPEVVSHRSPSADSHGRVHEIASSSSADGDCRHVSELLQEGYSRQDLHQMGLYHTPTQTSDDGDSLAQTSEEGGSCSE